MKIAILDAYNLMHRARFGMQFGDHHIIFNFFRGLRPIIEELAPDKIFLVLEGFPAHRHAVDSSYKANRLIDETSPKWQELQEFRRQKTAILDIVKMLPITVIRHPHLECDDVAASIALSHADDDCVIVSTDTDFIQLLTSPKIKLYNPVTKSFVQQYPHDYLTWKSLRGDKTDNVPPIPGMSDRKATLMLEQPGAFTKAMLDDDFRAAFDKNMSLIKFQVIPSDDPLIESQSYQANWPGLRNSLTDLKFAAIVKDGSWQKYVETFKSIYDD